jgi:phage shock protein E
VTSDSAQAAALLDTAREVLVVDVRTVDEYRSGHLVGAQNIDASDPERWESRTSALDKDQPTVVYCQSGRRSAEAAQRLVDAGFTEVYDLGGIQDWTDGDLPVDES